MSGYRVPGQFDDIEMERRIQDEIRRRSLHHVGTPYASMGPLGVDGQPPPPQSHPPPPQAGAAADYAQHLSIIQQAAVANQQRQQSGPPGGYPGYAGGPGVAHGHSPYSRVSNPYTGIADGRTAYQQSGPAGGGPLAQMYAAQQERQRQQQAAVAGSYGAPYGSGAAAGGGHSALDHHYASAYGLTATPATGYAREASYGSAGGTQSPHDHVAMMQHQQQQHLHSSQQPPGGDAYASASSTPNVSRNVISGSGTKSKESTAVGTPASTPSSNGKVTNTSYASSSSRENSPIDEDDSNYGNSNALNENSQHTIDTASSIPSLTNVTPMKGGRVGISPRSSGSSGRKSVGSKEKSPTHPGSGRSRVTLDDGTTIIEDGDQRWYTGCVPLGLEDDKYWLSELQVYLRSHFAEAFGATEDDIAAPMHGRNKPIALGQVGIRCMHCKRDNPAERGQQATSYPSLISGIYNSVQQMLRLHLDCCLSMPSDVRSKIEQLKTSCSSRGGRKQYWIDSAKRLGLVDTPHGIHFGRDPAGPLPPLAGPSVISKEGRIKKKTPLKSSSPQEKEISVFTPPLEESFSSEEIPVVASEEAPSVKQESPLSPSPSPSSPPPPPLAPVDARPLVFPDDKSLISDYLYLTLEQMAPCLLMEADRVGCYKTRKVGFPGLACKHCVGQAGCGRYFPASEASLSQTTTSQTIMNHVRNCRRCPNEIRENLEIMKRNRMGSDGKRADKPKHGGRKVFFHRLWCRIQDLPFEEGKAETKEGRKRKNRHSSSQSKKRRSRPTDDENDSELASDDEDQSKKSSGGSSEEETESEEETDNSDDESTASAQKRKPPRKTSISSICSNTPHKTSKKPRARPWFTGCVRLTKTDDPHWLSEMECFARSDLVEVFSYRGGDALDGYAGRRDPSDGQVGIRCVFCKALDPADRINGCVTFPDTLSLIHAKIADMIRLHFPSCPSMPDGAVQTFKSFRGFDAKVANDDSQQYWVDAARDIGLANLPPVSADTPDAWGITFRRDPLQPSPADELDLEQSACNVNISDAAFCKDSMVRFEDRGLCTDQVMLLLRQVRPCRFQSSDRRAGPGSRGRDRIMGFPGLCCMHCVGLNTLGRYFPVSSKNLTDSTTISLQAHVSSCAYCPESTKASLAYLGHRSILQKAELSGSWKKVFFKKVWDRLHVERGWESIDDDHQANYEGREKGKIEYEVADDQRAVDAAEHDDDEGDTKEDEPDVGAEAGSESENEVELGDSMNALIKAAAIWLTEQDNADSKAGSRAKKAAPVVPTIGRTAALPTTTKRRRVHF